MRPYEPYKMPFLKQTLSNPFQNDCQLYRQDKFHIVSVRQSVSTGDGMVSRLKQSHLQLHIFLKRYKDNPLGSLHQSKSSVKHEHHEVRYILHQFKEVQLWYSSELVWSDDLSKNSRRSHGCAHTETQILIRHQIKSTCQRPIRQIDQSSRQFK